jgi:glucosamine-6-phosphate deaminase
MAANMSLSITVHSSKIELGRAAAEVASRHIREAVASRGGARIIVGTGNSQDETIEALVETALDWRRVEVFHMDEYVGIDGSHPASFRRWLKQHLADRVNPGTVHYLAGEAADATAECERYGKLLTAGPIDVCFLGFGENGHIAFNDPHVADFADPAVVKRVEMDRRCRMQQVGEGHFPGIDAVPRYALTLTCPVLVSARCLVIAVPDLRKAEAVRNALGGPIGEACPASVVRTHANAHLFLDGESSSLIEVG